MFLASDADSGEVFFNDESGDFFAIDFGHDKEVVGPLGVADPHFGAVEDVLAVAFFGAGGHAEGVGAGVRFAEGIGADPLTAGEFGEILLFLFFGSEADESKLRDSAGDAVGDGEAGIEREEFENSSGKVFAESESAVGVRGIDSAEAELTGFFDESGHEAVFLFFQPFDKGNDFAPAELLGGFNHEFIVTGEVFGREDVIGRFSKE